MANMAAQLAMLAREAEHPAAGAAGAASGQQPSTQPAPLEQQGGDKGSCGKGSSESAASGASCEGGQGTAAGGAPASGGEAAAAACSEELPAFLRLSQIAAAWQPPATFEEQLALVHGLGSPPAAGPSRAAEGAPGLGAVPGVARLAAFYVRASAVQPRALPALPCPAQPAIAAAVARRASVACSSHVLHAAHIHAPCWLACRHASSPTRSARARRRPSSPPTKRLLPCSSGCRRWGQAVGSARLRSPLARPCACCSAPSRAPSPQRRPALLAAATLPVVAPTCAVRPALPRPACPQYNPSMPLRMKEELEADMKQRAKQLHLRLALMDHACALLSICNLACAHLWTMALVQGLRRDLEDVQQRLAAAQAAGDEAAAREAQVGRGPGPRGRGRGLPHAQPAHVAGTHGMRAPLPVSPARRHPSPPLRLLPGWHCRRALTTTMDQSWKRTSTSKRKTRGRPCSNTGSWSWVSAGASAQGAAGRAGRQHAARCHVLARGWAGRAAGAPPPRCPGSLARACPPATAACCSIAWARQQAHGAAA